MRLGVLAVAILGVLVASPGGAGARRALHGANFWVKCGFSHTANDDPIVYPRRPGASHSHTFFGNRSTDAYSIWRTLRAAGTTCRRPADKAAYWVPTLLRHGREVRPTSVGVYYRMKTTDVVHPFPAGLRIVAGNAAASRPQSLRVTYWTCWMSAGRTSTPPTCPRHGRFVNQKSVLTLHVIFPECWDGTHLDSADHRSHMAYANAALVCPASHPMQVPGLSLVIAYPVYDGRTVQLSSGGQLSAHGDFFNAWNQRILARLAAACSARTARADCADRIQPRM